MALTTVIVPSRKRLESLQRCIASIQAHTTDYELIVCDDSSGSDVRDYLDGLAGVTVIYSEGLCYAAAVNQAARIARGDYITIPAIANDIEVTPGWLSNMVAFMEENASVGMGVFKVSKPGGGIESYGGFVWPERLNVDPAVDPEYCGYGLVRRDCFEAVGLLDENFTPIYCEDADYGLRVLAAGYRVAVCAEAELIHHHEQSERTFDYQHNKEYLWQKHNLPRQ